ncbi:MAG: hypothetical protein ACYSUI_04395 [Planctomycetota bacterium]|jgi:hypothetical protein
MKRLSAILTVLALAIAPGDDTAAAPEPSLSPQSWELDFEFRDPTRITLTLPGDSQPTTFWYLLYSVTNNTGDEIEFYPSFHLVTDTLQVVEGGSNISPRVYEAIRARHKKEHPFMVDPPAVFGLLKQGEDNRLTSAAVFRNFDPEASHFTIYVGGLSGELARLSNPAFDPLKAESDKNSRSFVLRKTLAIEYDLPGDSRTRARAVPTRVKRDWVMR